MSATTGDSPDLFTSLNTASRDYLWWLAVAAGPIVWFALSTAGVTHPVGTPAVATLIYGVLLYPVIEEIVFRGLLQSALLQRKPMRRKLGPLSLANLATSLLFAASHLISQAPLNAAMILLPSLVFGWAFERYRHVAPSIVLHAFYNAGFLWLFAR